MKQDTIFTDNLQCNEAINSVEPPHNIEAEQEVLGSLLYNNKSYIEISDILEQEHFYDPLHQRIFAAIKNKVTSGQRADPITLKPVFDNESSIGELSVLEYLARLVTGAILSDVTSYALTIKDEFTKRELSEISQEIVSGISKDPVKLIMEAAQERLDALQDHGGSGKDTCSSIADSAANLIIDLKDPTPNDAISTSLRDLDKALCGGWQRGELHICAGRSSMGKSAFIVSSMLRSAKQGYEVLCFSLEMTQKALAARCLSDISYTRENPITYADILKKDVGEHQFPRLEDVQKKFADYPLWIDDQRGLSITQIHSRIRRYINKLDREGRKLDMVVIDHLGLVRTDKYANQRHLEIGYITDQLATIAKDFDIAVIALCQLNRGVEGRDNKRPTLADLRESGRIEEDAACVIGLYRPAYYLERERHDDIEKETERLEKLKSLENKYEAIILKQRNGPCRPVELWCNMATNSISNRGRA